MHTGKRTSRPRRWCSVDSRRRHTSSSCACVAVCVWRFLAGRGVPAEPRRRITEFNAPNHCSSRRSQDTDLGVSQLLPRFWRDQHKAELCISVITTCPFERYCVLNSDGVRALSHAEIDACNLARRDRLVLSGESAEVMFRAQSYPGLHPQSERAPSQRPRRCWTLGLRTCTVKVQDTPRKACWQDTLRFLRPVRCPVPYTLVETRAWSCIRAGRRATLLCVNLRQLPPWWLADRPGEHGGLVRSCLKGCI